MAKLPVYTITVLIDQDESNKQNKLVYQTVVAGNYSFFDFLTAKATESAIQAFKNEVIGELRKAITRLKNKKGMI